MPDHRALVAERRATFEHFRTIKPPPILGVEPPPKEEKEEDKKEQPPEEPGVLRGNPCAPGIVRGPVRIVPTMIATDRVQPGEIMVAPTTNPSWTTLFSTIGALVTEAGGKLSHGAVVAREYRIPAVLGVKDAMSQLEDGQLVEVDGSAGTIRLLDVEEGTA
jgi:pyruvate,water dikinase